MTCPCCKADLLHSHILENETIPPMSNRSRIIEPRCTECGYIIQLTDVAEGMMSSRRVLLMTGTAGAGKTALGQYIEAKTSYIFVDGDAVQKKVNHYAKADPGLVVNAQRETMQTMLILLALGYDVVVGYIINREALAGYREALEVYGISPVFRVLVPERSVCLQRDEDRECWTAGEEWVDKWYDEMCSYISTDAALCIDSSCETLEETYKNHFAALL